VQGEAKPRLRVCSRMWRMGNSTFRTLLRHRFASSRLGLDALRPKLAFRASQTYPQPRRPRSTSPWWLDSWPSRPTTTANSNGQAPLLSALSDTPHHPPYGLRALMISPQSGSGKVEIEPWDDKPRPARETYKTPTAFAPDLPSNKLV